MFRYKSGSNTITRRFGLMARPCDYTSEFLTCFNDHTINWRSINTFNGMSICDRPVSQYSGGYNQWPVNIIAPMPFLMAPCAGKFGNKIINPIYDNNDVSNKYLIEFCPAKQLGDNMSYHMADDLWTRYIMYYNNNTQNNGLAKILIAQGRSMAAVTTNYNGSIIKNTYGTLPSIFDSINFINGDTTINNAINVSLHLKNKPIAGSTKIKFKIFYVLNCINNYANLSSTFFSDHSSPFVVLNAAKTSSSFIDTTGDPSTCSSLWIPQSTTASDDYSWNPIWNLNDMSGDCYFYFSDNRPAGLSKLVKISDIWKSYYRTGTETTIYEEFSKSSGPGWTAKMYRGQLVRYSEITWTAESDTEEQDFRYINCCFGIDGSYAGNVSNDIPLIGLGSFWVAIESG